MRNQIEDYASQEAKDIWSAEQRIFIERNLWVIVMSLQADLGVPIPADAILDYEREVELIDLESIAAREARTRHDLRARLEEFNHNAGHQYAHWGLTSCDITDNATQVQIRLALDHASSKVLEVLALLAAHIEASRDVVCVARTHNQPAQLTLLGKRFATIADTLVCGLGGMRMFRNATALRGLVGAVGTGQDLLALLGGNVSKLERLNSEFRSILRFETKFCSTGQTYPRSEDVAMLGGLVGLVSPLAELARLVRLESGYGRMWESQELGQVGSSAMPHKNNPVISERICGLMPVVRGYQAMLAETAGVSWYEGDVSDSVTRRIALPGLFYAVDAILENSLELLRKLDLDKVAYAGEVDNADWKVLWSGEMLSAALLAGGNRDDAYRALQNAETPDHLLEFPGWPFGGDRNPRGTNDPHWFLRIPELKAAQAQISQVLGLITEVIANAEWKA